MLPEAGAELGPRLSHISPATAAMTSQHFPQAWPSEVTHFTLVYVAAQMLSVHDGCRIFGIHRTLQSPATLQLP